MADLPIKFKLYLATLAVIGMSRSVFFVFTNDPNPLPEIRAFVISPSPIVFTNAAFFIQKKIIFNFENGKQQSYEINEASQWLFFGKIFFYSVMYAHETDNRDWHRIMNYSFCQNMELSEKTTLTESALLSLDIVYFSKSSEIAYKKSHTCYR